MSAEARPGELPSHQRLGVAVGWVLTLVIASVGGHMLWNAEDSATDYPRTIVAQRGADPFWFKNGLVLLLVVALFAFVIPRSQISRSLRAAVALPLLHVVALIVAWIAFHEIMQDTSPAARFLTIPIVAVGYATFSLAVAWASARKSREVLDAFVVMSLLNLLFLGLWLPVAARFGVGDHKSYVNSEGLHTYTGSGLLDWVDGRLIPSWKLVAYVVIPAFALATIGTVAVMRFPAWVRRYSGAWVGILGLLFVEGVISRSSTRGAAPYAAELFDNFTHVLLTLAALAIGALALLGVAIWVRRSRAGRGEKLEGTIASDDGGHVGWIEFPSRLRGPITEMRSFTLKTDAGDVPIDGGRLVVPLALSTTWLELGERAIVLNQGDRVVVSGFESDERGDHPFRKTSAPVAGGAGLVVTPTVRGTSGAITAALAMWRPCMIYLAILTVAAIPALVGAAVVP